MKFEIEFHTVTYYKTTVEVTDRAALDTQLVDGDEILFGDAVEIDGGTATITSITRAASR